MSGILKRLKRWLTSEEGEKYIPPIGEYVEVEYSLDWRGYEWHTAYGYLKSYQDDFPYIVELDNQTIVCELCKIRVTDARVIDEEVGQRGSALRKLLVEQSNAGSVTVIEAISNKAIEYIKARDLEGSITFLNNTKKELQEKGINPEAIMRFDINTAVELL